MCVLFLTTIKNNSNVSNQFTILTIKQYKNKELIHATKYANDCASKINKTINYLIKHLDYAKGDCSRKLANGHLKETKKD